MGLAASALGGSGSGRSRRLTRTITSRASAKTKEAPARYEWKRLASGNSKEAFTESSAIQQMIETILMFTDIFVPCDPILCVHGTKIYRLMRWLDRMPPRGRRGKTLVRRAMTGSGGPPWPVEGQACARSTTRI